MSGLARRAWRTEERPWLIRRLILAALAVAFLLFPAVVQASPGCHSDVCRERVARKQCSQARVVPCIQRAALHWRQPFRDLLRVARCESGLNPSDSNVEGATGLFQFLRSTWSTTRYSRRSIWSAKWSALAAAWMWHVGRRSEWVCQ